jgi:hypothetical protein
MMKMLGGVLNAPPVGKKVQEKKKKKLFGK